VTDVRCFREAECDTDHFLQFADVRERLAVSKQVAQKFDGERFHLSKLNDMEVKKEYQIKVINMFAALENLRDNQDIIRAWEIVKKNIKTPEKMQPKFVRIEGAKTIFQ
jgi:hypothetical protein